MAFTLAGKELTGGALRVLRHLKVAYRRVGSGSSEGLVFMGRRLKLGFFLTGKPSIPACMRCKTTSVKIIKGSAVVRRKHGIRRILSLKFKGYEVYIYKCRRTTRGLGRRRLVHITAGCPGVTGSCFCGGGRRAMRVIGLGNSVRLTPVINLSRIVMSVMRANSALGRGKLIMLRRIYPLSTQVVIGPIDVQVRGSEVGRLVAGLEGLLERR